VPSLEGLIRNRYIGRTFIEGNNRADKVRMKYTPLPEVMEGKRVLLVDDSIVRATTLRELLIIVEDSRDEQKRSIYALRVLRLLRRAFTGLTCRL
jgi:glutamine phosphoribosylpyrophosphate amidotransferase